MLALEKLLIEDTDKVVIPSIRPTRAKPLVPTIMPSTAAQLQAYQNRACGMLNGWAKRSPFAVRGQVIASDALGIGILCLEKIPREEAATPMKAESNGLLKALDHIRKAMPRKLETIDIVRGVMLFERNRLYVVKPIGQRHWTQTAAMNDADEIAGTILMQAPEDKA